MTTPEERKATMRAAVLRNGEIISRDDVPTPEPGRGEVLIRVLATGVCGGDLHFTQHSHELAALADRMTGAPTLTDGLDLEADVFMGHEFVGEVVAVGPETDAPPIGTVVTAMPALLTTDGMRPRLYSNAAPGGYAEYMVLDAPLVLAVPDSVDPRLAALAEPMAVGLHAVNRAPLAPGAGAIVIGAGPAGISVIAALKAQGVSPIIASDLSSTRRDLARTFGADEVIDPRTESIFHAWGRLGVGTPVVFEAVGVPGMLNSIMRDAPHSTPVIVVGASMEPDEITPYFGIAKEISLQFVQAYTPDEFAESLRRIVAGEVDVRPMITGEVGLDGVAQAFADLSDPAHHSKILVIPGM